MSSDDEDEEPVREPVEAGDIVLFTRFGNGVSSELVGRLGVLLETNETRRWIHAFDEDEPVRRAGQARSARRHPDPGDHAREPTPCRFDFQPTVWLCNGSPR